ncbi:MAG: hypothetical protein ACF8R7_18500 [Phycisphaerales bacterium JB039]
MTALPQEAGLPGVFADDGDRCPELVEGPPRAATDPLTFLPHGTVAPVPALVGDIEAAALDCLQRFGRCEAHHLRDLYGFDIRTVLEQGVAATRAAKRRLGLA